MHHRKIYEINYGPIPIDENGRTYEIHHIDGNHSNNDPSNLKAVSIREHYDIHYSQGNWDACLRISSRMKISPEEKSDLGRKSNKAKVAAGTHIFLNKEFQEYMRNFTIQRVIDGTHNFLDDTFRKELTKLIREKVKNNEWHTQQQWFKDLVREIELEKVRNGTHMWLGENNPVHKRIQDGTHISQSEEFKEFMRTLQNKKVIDGDHHLLGGEIQRRTHKKNLENGTHHLLGETNPSHSRVKNGTHNFQGPNSPSQWKWICEHCGNQGKGKGPYKQHHGDNCKMKLEECAQKTLRKVDPNDILCVSDELLLDDTISDKAI